MAHTAFSDKAFAAKAREVTAEGCVLLRNENNALPLQRGSRIALFGRTQMNYYKSGLGSGGLVNARYVVGIYDALRDSGEYCLDSEVRSVYEQWTEEHPFDSGDGWAHHPWYQQEMPVEESLVQAAAQRNDAAVVIIGRTAGEDRDNADEPGSWRLTAEEEGLLDTVCRCFARSVVLLNTGSIIDMSWVKKYSPSAVMYLWQGGQEGGNGVLDILSGRVCPSGRLVDTIAESICDYPSHENFGHMDKCVYAEDIYVGYRYFESCDAKGRVLYPFGFGLSYTQFEHTPLSFDYDGEKAVLRHRVTNTGGCAGKEVVQVYVSAPLGSLGKSRLALCGFAKTRLLQSGESQEVEIVIPRERLVSYDDSGATGNRCCYVLEEGSYSFFAGANVRDLKPSGEFEQAETIVTERLEECCAPVEAFDRLRLSDSGFVRESTPLRTVSQQQRRKERLPEAIPLTENKGLRLKDAAEGNCTMEQFVAQLTPDDLCCLVRGEGMSSPRVTPGTAACMGGVTDRLINTFGLPSVCCSDGPSGIRMDCGNKAFSMPSGVCQACTWNEQLIAELYVFEGLEMRKYQVDNLLGPGMNIHRHPLNGRNFEYFSEDPLVTGRIACAQLRGLHESGVTGTVKHYACNNQEKNRRHVNAVVSERALREIYLKGFEIAIKEGGARAVMTTYNPLNGCWTASEYDLVTTILRGEWGFDGIVMTDWWAMGSEEGKEPSVSNVASMVRAQNDLFMVTNNPAENSGNDDCAEALAGGLTTLGEFQRSALNICRFLIETPAFRRTAGMESEEDIGLRQLRDDDDEVMLSINEILLDAEAVISGDDIDTTGGQTNLYQMKLRKHGQYRLSITCRAREGVLDTVQLPFSLFVDSNLAGSWTLSGGDKEWRTFSATTLEMHRRLIFYTRLFFAVGGLEVRELRIERIKTFD
ncbi:MAG: beta-glucosidase [Ruminococcaceae bacterium]|nr:beta-glucosidase [Oscillospiraceae bacterium]